MRRGVRGSVPGSGPQESPAHPPTRARPLLWGALNAEASQGAEASRVEPCFRSPTHQLGGDVLSEAHGRDAVRADHQQRDDDMHERQPIGEVGPVGGACVSTLTQDARLAPAPRPSLLLPPSGPSPVTSEGTSTRLPPRLRLSDGFPPPLGSGLTSAPPAGRRPCGAHPPPSPPARSLQPQGLCTYCFLCQGFSSHFSAAS